MPQTTQSKCSTRANLLESVLDQFVLYAEKLPAILISLLQYLSEHYRTRNGSLTSPDNCSSQLQDKSNTDRADQYSSTSVFKPSVSQGEGQEMVVMLDPMSSYSHPDDTRVHEDGAVTRVLWTHSNPAVIVCTIYVYLCVHR